jgi:ABC-2 type transport system permease protein
MTESCLPEGGASSTDPPNRTSSVDGGAGVVPPHSLSVVGPTHRASYSRLSMRRMGAICANTLTELTRKKLFYFLLLFGILLIGGSVFLARFSFQQEFQILKDISLGAMSIFGSLLAIAATAQLIPHDIEDRTIYSILAKPVPRFEYVIGRLGGVLLLLAINIVAMTAVFVIVLYAREQTILRETSSQMSAAPAEQLHQALAAVRAMGVNRDLFPAIAAIYLKACVLAALTLLVSTFATSSLFTIVVMVFAYFIGHLQGIAREYWLHEHGADWMARLFLALVALVFPDLQAFNLVDSVVAGAVIPFALFLKTAGLGLFYVIVYTALATVAFSAKEL